MNKLLTSKEAAELLGITPRDLRALCRDGELRFVMVTPRKRRFREVDLEDFVNRKLTPGKAKADKPPSLPVRSPVKADKASLVKEMAGWD